MHKPSMRRANSAELPPLRALPPPITLSSLPSVNIDLDVDYQTEVAPFLGTCLVSTCLLLSVHNVLIALFVIVVSSIHMLRKKNKNFDKLWPANKTGHLCQSWRQGC